MYKQQRSESKGHVEKKEHAFPKNSIRIQARENKEFQKILTPDALQFIATLHQKFNPERERLLRRRQEVQEKIDAKVFPSFLSQTTQIRESTWAVAEIPQDILDRRVEITGPVDRKMMINALNSGAQVFMADFEDSHAPTWKGTIEGQVNLFDAVRGKLDYLSPQGKLYSLMNKSAVLFVRPRGWHLHEKHVLIDGTAISASLFDFGLYFFHNASELLKQGKRPYFYLPKMESHLEARLWNDVFCFAQDFMQLERGSIRATVLIETILAAFEMDEILYELRDHSAGLNCGRWDYIFSFIKKFRNHPEFVFPDRVLITMNTPFLKSYCQQLIRVCHRRKIHAMGGMAAQIPIKEDPVAHAAAMEKVISDKKREVSLGHDGTWVAHPGLVEVARSVFDEGFHGPHQISVNRESWEIRAEDLLSVPLGEITEQGLRANIHVSLFYLESWLRGSGCVPLSHLMEDAATAEISRAQIWQWIKHGRMSATSFHQLLGDELSLVKGRVGKQDFQNGKFELAAEILRNVSLSPEFPEFLTTVAYSYL